MRSPISRVRLIALAAGAVVALMVAPLRGAANDIPDPDEFFGRKIGAPGVLVRHSEILEYYRLLAERSDRVTLHEIGETTQGRPFYYAIVTAPENHARLHELIADNDRLYDPRGLSDQGAERIIREGKSFVIVNQQIHSTEVGVSQGGVLLAHRLAAGEDAEVAGILRNVVVVHVPVHNPDGQEMVAKWLDEQRGTEYQNAPPPFLYHEYVGHDNNRDWYMFTQAETRLSVQMQNRFHPQFTLDQHQQGSRGSRIFVPPFEDPWEPNVDPALIAANNMIGTFMGNYLVSRGYRGVEWKQRYDAWTPARAYYHTHGGVRILSEVASATYADDVEVPFESLNPTHQEHHWYFPFPWPGGTWSFKEVVDYSYAGAMGALRAAADLRPHLLRGMLAAQRRSVEPPSGSPWGFVVPAEQSDPPTAVELLQVLHLADVEIEQAIETFSVGGVQYGAGSHVIRFAQPAGRFAKSVLERQQYPQMFLYEGGPIDPPYDVTAHTLPALMNVRVDTVDAPITAALDRLAAPVAPAGGLVDPAGTAVAFLMDPVVNRSFAVAAGLAGRGLQRSTEAFQAAGRWWPAGTWIYALPRGAEAVAAAQQLADSVARHGVAAVGVDEVPQVSSGWIAAPRVALYDSYVPSMAGGWLRFVLDQYGIGYDIVRNRDIRAGDLALYGVIVVPPGDAASIVDGRSSPPMPPAFAGGIGEQGVEALRAYLQAGGTVFTWSGSTELGTRYLAGPENLAQRYSRTELNIPGSLLNVEFDPEHWLAYGMQEQAPVFFWRSPFWAADSEATVVARYAHEGLLHSGWIQGEELVAGAAAMIELRVGDGSFVMVGFSPEYRAQAHATFKLIFNAVFPPRVDKP